jgi:hypothetical protein
MIATLRSLRRALLLFAARAALHWRGVRAEHRVPHAAELMLEEFRRHDAPSCEAYASLFRYFMTGFAARRSALGAGADYAGMDSYNGPAMDRLEGFSRVAPLVAAWLHGGRDAAIDLPGGESLDLVAVLKSGLLAGTDPASPEYWGGIKHWGQAIVEAADIALALWLSRDVLWNALAAHERQRIGDWLIQVNGRRLPDNNWHLFVVQTNAVLASLEMPYDAAALQTHYERSKSFYRGNGWFTDGELDDAPGFDYYNAWGFHYQLQWLRRILPEFDSQFIDGALREFVAVYRYFIGPAGFPMMGRSTCYRMAAPVPLVFAQERHPDVVSAGQARRALDVIWRHFISRGALRRGNVTQGYFRTDARVIESYSGPASCLWSLRSLVAAFALPDNSDFWQSPPEPLPVELGDYRIEVAPPGWTIVGNQASGTVTLLTGHKGFPPLAAMSQGEKLLGLFFEKPPRPKNIPAKYCREKYVSTSPYTAADGEPG